MKQHARVVIIGGGAMGVGLAYHLPLEGWNDVVLIDKGELTSGSTWHAAGLIPNFIGSLNMAKVHAYGIELYDKLEAETGQATGWHGCGALRLAVNDDEVDWFHYVKGILDYIGVESHLVGHAEMKEIHPLLKVDGVKLGFYTPNDGHTDPASSTNSMAVGARNRGVEIIKRNRVTGVERTSSGEWKVITEQGSIICEHVVNAAGSFSDQIAQMTGFRLPIVNMEHQYLVTENLPEIEALDKEPPVVRDPVASCYIRQEQKGLLVGPYETSGAVAWGVDGIDWSFDMELLPESIERLEHSLIHAAERVPLLANAGIKRVVNGPITHTPDGGFLLGPAGGLENYWLCCGASIGITQGPGAGKYLAQWMVHGQTEINVREMDPRRYGEFANTPGRYVVDKSIDEYQEMYQVHLPGEFREAGRPVKTTPIYEKLKAAGAVYGEYYGWERPKWFSLDGSDEEYSFRRSNVFNPVAEECKCVEQRVGVADLTAFSKYMVTGSDAEKFLNRIGANRTAKRDGGMSLTHMLTDLGGIECEIAITRLAQDRFFLTSAIVAQQHDLDWMVQHIGSGEEVKIEDVTDQFGMLAIAGPRSRDLLAKLTDSDLSNESFRWLTGQEIDVGGMAVIALRVSYVGELGWELYHPIEVMSDLCAQVEAAGEEFGLGWFGSYAVNCMRLEKGYKGWGSELTTEITPVEADIERFVDYDSEFIGRGSVLKRKAEGISTKLVLVSVDADDADCMGNEPAMDGERPMGIVCSGAFGHRTNMSLAYVYVEPQFSEAGKTFEIPILGVRRTATVLADAPYDPLNQRLRV